MPSLSSVTLQWRGWMPVELKYGAVRERHIAAERGHCDPARECGGDVAELLWSAFCLIWLCIYPCSFKQYLEHFLE